MSAVGGKATIEPESVDRRIGVARRRDEDADLTSGTAVFTEDLVGSDALQVAFARAAPASGWLRRLDVGAARAAPEVVGVATAATLDVLDIPDATGAPGGPSAPHMRRSALVRERVRYSGEPVAAVVAEQRGSAVDAAELVAADIEPLPAVVGIEEALADEHLLFASGGTNVVATRRLPAEEPFDPLPPCEVSASLVLDNQRLAPVPVEPLTVIAEPSGDGVAVWCPTQTPQRLRDELARCLQRPPQSVRVVVPNVGGAFGHKAMFFPEVLVVAALALRMSRRVAWTETRYEQFVGGTHGRAQRHWVDIGGDRSGRIRALRVSIVGDAGAYPHNGSKIPFSSAFMASGPYAIEDLKVEARLVVTNTAPTGSYRGAGRPEAAYTVERAVDAFARRCGLEPEEVRRRNLVPAASMPYTTPTGATYDSGDYVAALDRACELVGLDDVRAEQARRGAGAARLLGVGFGAFVERAGGARTAGEHGTVELLGDGSVRVLSGTTPTGQGHATTWRQIVAETLGLDDETAIEVLAGDTRLVPTGTGSFGSRSAQVGGSALLRASQRLLERARAEAADAFEANPADVGWDGQEFFVAGDPDARMSLASVAGRHVEREGVPMTEADEFAPGVHTFPYGVHAAVVEVDTETGRVRLERMAAVDDCGRVINPLLVKGQIHGSLLQGIGQALYEEFAYDDAGQPVTTGLFNYLAPTAPDAPGYETAHLETPASSNPLGAKGAGESGCIGAPPAIVNAALDALAPLGVADLRMPLTPYRVWQAIAAARAQLTIDEGSPR